MTSEKCFNPCLPFKCGLKSSIEQGTRIVITMLEAKLAQMSSAIGFRAELLRMYTIENVGQIRPIDFPHILQRNNAVLI